MQQSNLLSILFVYIASLRLDAQQGKRLLCLEFIATCVNNGVMECVTIITTVVRLLPTSHMLATPGGNISFTCLPLYAKSEIETFEWKVNQTLLKNFTAQNIETHSSAAGNGLGTLMINGVSSQYNMTTVQCGVTFSSGQEVDSNLASIMILQGTVFFMYN